MIEPTEADIGRRVAYTGNAPFGGLEPGIITSFNAHSVFVQYDGKSHSQATARLDLQWAGETTAIITPVTAGEDRSQESELTAFALRMTVSRMQMRIDAINERGGETVGISLVFASDIVSACKRGADYIEASVAQPSAATERDALRAALVETSSELEGLLAMCNGEAPSLLRDHHSFPKIMDALDAACAALALSAEREG